MATCRWTPTRTAARKTRRTTAAGDDGPADDAVLGCDVVGCAGTIFIVDPRCGHCLCGHHCDVEPCAACDIWLSDEEESPQDGPRRRLRTVRRALDAADLHAEGRVATSRDGRKSRRRHGD